MLCDESKNGQLDACKMDAVNTVYAFAQGKCYIMNLCKSHTIQVKQSGKAVFDDVKIRCLGCPI